MKAIETFYKGYHFRSRIEARWAVFFDAIKVEWKYELEGYLLSNGSMYLPDFYLPGIGYVEIKGKNPAELESAKTQLLCLESKQNVYIFWGEIPYSEDGINFEQWPIDSAHVWRFEVDQDGWPKAYWDNFHRWCRCAVCGKYGIQFEGRAARICMPHDEAHENYYHGSDKGYNREDTTILEAYDLARAERFDPPLWKYLNARR